MDDLTQLSGGILAYLGDSVLELMTRRRLLERGLTTTGALNREARNYVTAVAQSAALDKILPALDDEEEYAYKRGRNANDISPPHSATVAEYRRATGLEALFAYLYLKGRTERMDELFELGFGDKVKTE